MLTYDVLVVGSGHAGCTAALSALDSGSKSVLVVDKCPPEWAGGNGYFTAGAFRTVHAGIDDLLPVLHDAASVDVSKIDMTPYTSDDFTRDIMRLGDNRSDPNLVNAVVQGSRDAITWLSSRVKVPFTFSFNRQAYEVNGRQRFWGGMVLSVHNGGKGLTMAHQAALKEANVEIWYDSPAVQLLVENGEVVGIVLRRDGQLMRVRSAAVILAAGGFEASKEMRIEHLGEDWGRAKVRGTPFNTGDGINMARNVGAKLYGDWRGCHSTAWDANAPNDRGDRELSNQFTKSGYPLGIMVNANGTRFVDEGEDFRNYTYAKFGRKILQQPDGFAFQVWDAKVTRWLRKEEYGDGVVEKIYADSIEELAEKLEEKGLKDLQAFENTLSRYNECVRSREAELSELKWEPAVKDGLTTQSGQACLDIPKSNWALTLEEPPFLAVKVSCGITFTFGGIAIDPASAAVLSHTGQPIEGLFSTGEMVGGLFYGNYPGGSGLTAGAVFGRISGKEAAMRAHTVRERA